MKAGMGLTRHKLAADPDTAPWVPRIFEWRILDHLALTAIARRLDELGAPARRAAVERQHRGRDPEETRSTPGTWCGAGRRGTARAAAPPR